MLTRMWRNGNPLALLVGMQTGAATLENNIEVPQKITNRTTLWPSNCTTRCLFKGYKNLIWRGTCTPMFIAELSTIAKLWKEPKCPSIDKCIKKMWHGAPGWRSRLSVRLQPGHDLAVCEFEPRVRLWADGSEPGACFRFCVSLSLCPSPVHALSLSVPKINKTLKKKFF